MNLKKRLLAGAGLAALMAVPAVISMGHDAPAPAPNVQMAQADIGGALSDIFAREAATMAYLDFQGIAPGADYERTKFGMLSRGHSWAVVEYLEDLRAQCDAPLVDDCAQDIKQKILGVFAGYESSLALKDWDKIRMDVFEVMVRHDNAITDLRDYWGVWDVNVRRAGLQHTVNLMSQAFSDEGVWFAPADVVLMDIPDPTVAAYFQASDGEHDAEIVFRSQDLAAMSFDVAWDLIVHESGHNIRQQQMYMLDNPQFEGYFLQHGIRNDIRLLQIAAFEVPVQYGAVNADGLREWHGMNPAEKDVIAMAARAGSFFDVATPAVPLPQPRPAIRLDQTKTL